MPTRCGLGVLSKRLVSIYTIPWLSRLPLHGAEWLSYLASERKTLGFTYVISVFFIIPGALLAVTSLP